MKILIRAGRVGESVAESLVSERNDITVIDNNPARLRELQDRLDLRGVVGNGTQPIGRWSRRSRRRRHGDRLRRDGRDQSRGLQDRARRVQRADRDRARAQPEFANGSTLMGKRVLRSTRRSAPKKASRPTSAS